MRPWWSACLPSVADTCEREISSSRRGSAPILSSFARSCALWIVKPPEIWAPFCPSMPSGFSRKLMYGVEISSLSSRIAKWCDAPIGSVRPPLSAALSAPRCAIARVVRGERLAALAREVHRHDRRAAALLVEVLLRVLDVRAVQHGVVAEHPPCVDLARAAGRSAAGPRCGRRRCPRAPRGSRRCPACPACARSLPQRGAVLVRDAVVQRPVRDLVEGVVDRAVVRVVAVDLRLAASTPA